MTFLSEYCCRNTQGYNIVPTESNNVCARNTKQTLELLRATDKTAEVLTWTILLWSSCRCKKTNAVCAVWVLSISTFSNRIFQFLWFLWFQKTYLFHRLRAQVRIQWLAEITDEIRPSHADSSGRKSLKNYDEQLTSSTSLSTFRSVLRHSGNHESASCAHWICQQGRTQCRRVVWRIWKHCLENGISGVEHQKQNFWRNGTQPTWSHGKRDARWPLFF